MVDGRRARVDPKGQYFTHAARLSPPPSLQPLLDMASSTDSKTDLEKVDLKPFHPAEMVLEEEVASATGPFARLTRWLDAQGVEARGLDRVPESERQPVSFAGEG